MAGKHRPPTPPFPNTGIMIRERTTPTPILKDRSWVARWWSLSPKGNWISVLGNKFFTENSTAAAENGFWSRLLGNNTILLLSTKALRLYSRPGSNFSNFPMNVPKDTRSPILIVLMTKKSKISAPGTGVKMNFRVTKVKKTNSNPTLKKKVRFTS